ncbi:MAG TPA: hypothetical protein VH575_36810 [Gemmataceae bacterium]
MSEIPLELITQNNLEQRIRERGGEKEVEFLFRDTPRLLPVWIEGRLRVATWGNNRGESRALPCSGWTQRETVESGGWAAFQTKTVIIPASLGLEKKVWFRIHQGERGLLVEDDRGTPRVYVICEPSTHYYQVKTRSRWMPLYRNDDTRRGSDVRGSGDPKTCPARCRATPSCASRSSRDTFR